MTVTDLISILQHHDPAAVVVLRWDMCDFEQSTVWEELRQGAVQSTQLKRLSGVDGGWDPLGGAKLYAYGDAGEDEDEAVDVVQLG
jgi:hypothetical protein